MGKYIYFDDTRASGWTIGSVEFDTQPVWVDRFAHAAKVGSAHELIGGNTVQQVFDRNLTGLPITLKLSGSEGCLSLTRAIALKALCDAGNAVNFTPGTGQTPISVVFDYSQSSPIDLSYFDDNKVMLIGTIYLRRA